MPAPPSINLTTESGNVEDVAFFIFNRPELTEKVFAEIARYRPARLLVVADGPRDRKEAQVCDKVRQVIDQVDWDCEVLRNFSETNLGCKKRISSGLAWVFEHCERAIILEDDCLPDPSFFQFCSALLEHYADDERVMHIGGSNFCEPQTDDDATYYISRHTDIWGWATWRRAFARYDVEMAAWPGIRDFFQNGAFVKEQIEIDFWTNAFDDVVAGAVDTWDYQWHFAVIKNRGLACIPKVNLISNLGWGENATHTLRDDSIVSLLPRSSLEEVRHPPSMTPDERTDAAFFDRRYFRGCFFEHQAKVIADARHLRGKRDDILSLVGGDGRPLRRPAAALMGLPFGAVPPGAFDLIRTDAGWWARVLRRLCRVKLIQSANLALHRATLIGNSAISEMEESLIAKHFAIPALIGDHEGAPVVFDVGSYRGAFARQIRRAWPASRVLAFDPNQEPQAELTGAGVEFHRIALGAVTGPVTLYRKEDNPDGPEASLSREVTLFTGSGEKIDEKTVECATIDAFVTGHDLDRVDLMHISVNGMEWEVLFGAVESLKNGSLPALIFKFGPVQALTATPMIYFFNQLRGYTLYRMTPSKLARMDSYNFVTSEVYADQHILAVARYHPRSEAIWQISRR